MVTFWTSSLLGREAKSDTEIADRLVIETCDIPDNTEQCWRGFGSICRCILKFELHRLILGV